MEHLDFIEFGEQLEKAIDTGTLADLVPQDLEIEAHNTLWSETDAQELTFLRLLPSTPATSIKHEFTQITSFSAGGGRSDGFFGEKTLPGEGKFATARREVYIRLLGEVGPTFLLASLEKTQRALGTTGAVNIQRQARRLSVLRKKNRALLRSDTSTQRAGVDGIKFKGIAQLIREGTDGTTGTASPFGSHAIDMEGQPLNADTIRQKMGRSTILFGPMTDLVMSPMSRLDFEASFDSAGRINLPFQAQPFLIGQMIGGMQTQHGRVHFHTDNILTPDYYQGKYSTELEAGAPATRPTVAAPTAAAAAGGRSSKFKSGDTGAFFWVVTEVVDGIEGLGVRAPASGTVSVAVGDEVTLSITPGNPLADSFRVYRGSGAEATTDAWFVFEVANSGGGGAVTAYDGNLYRPNTEHAFMFRLVGAAQQAMHEGMTTARNAAASFLKANDNPQNTVSIAHLGPQMGIMELAAILATVSRPLIYTACAPEVRNPYQNLYFYNVKPTVGT